MRLYTFTITPNNRKVEAFVRHFDLPVEVHHVSFKDRETQSPEYLAINPMARVPALVDGDFKLWESNAIVRYLARVHGAGTLWPDDAREGADADRWMDWQATAFNPAIGPAFWHLIRFPAEQRDAKVIEAARVSAEKKLAMLDAHLPTTAEAQTP